MKIYRITLLLILTLAACGGGGGGDTTNPTLSLLAGNMDGPGSSDGSGAAASFEDPFGIASDSAGNLYVADTSNHTIRKITAAGVVSTLAGTTGISGSSDGSGAAASFADPRGLVSDSAGNIYVADTLNSTIRKITAAGMVSTIAGTVGVFGSSDGSGAAASFAGPSGLTSDSAGNLYVADTYNHTIRKITATGVVSTFAGTAGVSGSSNGSGGAASFSYPWSITSDSAGNLYVADSENHTIRKITAAGVVSTFAGTAGVPGSSDGSGTTASFYYPRGITSDSADNLYVADTANHTIRKITAAGVVSTLAGTAGVYSSSDGSGGAASFYHPFGITSDSVGNLYVADTFNHTIRKITAAGVVTTFAGTAGVVGSSDGSGAAASFNNPFGITSDRLGNLYLADTRNNTIRKITAAGVVTTFAGTGVSGSSDGSGSAASFSGPIGITRDGVGNLYVADTYNHTIRKITTAGTVSTLAGTAGISGSSDGNGAAASFFYPWSIASDNAGNLYVADTYNHTIRKITTAGTVSTLAGTAGISGSSDGNGVAASFFQPSGITSDSAGNLYVADTSNHTIRKITAAGVVTTFAGTAGVVGSSDSSGAAASFYSPQGIASDSAGNLYVADNINHTIRKITAAGVVTTVVGVAGQGGFIPGILPGTINYPRNLAIHGNSLYITMNNGVAVVNGLP